VKIRPRSSLIQWAVALAFGGLACADASRMEAEGAASRWAGQHAEGWTLEVEADEARGDMVSTETFGTQCANGLFGLRIHTSDLDLDLFFKCTSPGRADLPWLRENLDSYGLSRLPVAIGAEGWSFQAFPESSGLRSGLTFDSWENEELALRISTPLFAVIGESQADACKAAAMVADGPGNPGCFVTVPYAGPLELSMTVTLDPTIFFEAVPKRF
jgi:hypothetical protein